MLTLIFLFFIPGVADGGEGEGGHNVQHPRYGAGDKHRISKRSAVR